MEKAMLWLPGWGMSDQVWTSIRSHFPSHLHITPDYSGVTSPSHFYEAIEKEVRSVGSLPLQVVGWSMGGMLAQWLATQHQVSGLVLISTTARFVRSREERDKGWTEAVLQKMQRSLAVDRARVMEGFVQSMATEQEYRQEAGFQQAAGAEWNLEALMAGLDYLREEDCRHKLSSLTCPALVIHGTADGICPFAAGEELASLMPNSAFLPLQDCGHAPMISQTDTMIDAVKRMVENDVEDGRRKSV